MPNLRTPLAKAEITGRTYHDAKRFEDRKEPKHISLGQPSAHLSGTELVVWEAFKRELPWVSEADRSLVESACMLRARLWDGHRNENTIMRLLTLLGRLGATPVDRSRIIAPKEYYDDPSDEFLN